MDAKHRWALRTWLLIACPAACGGEAGPPSTGTDQSERLSAAAQLPLTAGAFMHFRMTFGANEPRDRECALSDDLAIAALVESGRARLACFVGASSDDPGRDDVWFTFPTQVGRHGPAAVTELALQHGLSMLYEKTHATFEGGAVSVDGWDPATRRIIGRASAVWRDGPLGPAEVLVRFNAPLMPPR